ncbi:hypothetical protein Tco_0078088 [Tanacetum coccineum]
MALGATAGILMVWSLFPEGIIVVEVVLAMRHIDLSILNILPIGFQLCPIVAKTIPELTIITEDAPSSADKGKLKELTMGSGYGLLFGHLTKTFKLKKNFNQLSTMLFEALKEMLPSMVNKEVNKISKTTVPVYVAEGLLLERQKTQADVAAMIVEAIKKERNNLCAEIILQVSDAITNHIPPQIKFEKITTATACRPSAIHPRDHDDYQDDDARPEGENSTKKQKMSKHGTYLLGESSSRQAMEQEPNPSGLGTQEQLDEFDAWMEDARTDDDEVPNDKFTEREEHQYHVDQMQNYLKSNIVWESRKERLTSTNPKKKALSFYFPNDDIEERTSDEHAEYDESNTYVLERFNTTAGNPVKKILLKLNLSDHRLFKDGGGDFRYSDTARLSRSVEVLKLKNFKKDATLKPSKSSNQEWYEHVGPEVASSQDGKVSR